MKLPPTAARWRIALLACAALAHLALLPALPLGLRGTLAQLILLLPGALLALWLLGDEADGCERAMLALAGGVAFQALALYAIYLLPAAMPWWLVLLPFDAAALAAGWRLLAAPPRPAALPPRAELLALATVLLAGAAFRLPYLGHAEYQGDEARAILMAADAVRGREDILLWHSKGPVEILLPAAPLALLGAANEWAARLPFALAGLGVLLGAYVLGRRVLGSGLAGLVAAAALALDGFMIGFSRLLQYQMVLALMAVAAFWCAWRFRQGAARPARLLLAAALFAATGLLAHYDGLFVLPALAWLAIAGGARRGWRPAQWLRMLAPPLLLATALLASFYVPFFLHEHFLRTLKYLGKRTGQTDGVALFNNLPAYYTRATFYSTAYQIIALGAALLAGMLAWLWRYGRPRPLGLAMAALLLLASAATLASWPLALPSGLNLALLAFGLPLAALALSPATPAPLRAVLVWFAAPFLAESFVLGDPKTHFYTMYPACALLVGLAVAQLVALLRRRARPLLWPLACGGAALALLAAPFLTIAYLRQSPEYRFTFGQKPAIYQALTTTDLVAVGGFFGFPHSAGWRVVGELYRTGAMRGSFGSNEDYLIGHWYTRRAPRCDTSPDYYVLADIPFDQNKLPEDQIRQQFHLFASIRVGGEQKMQIYSRQPVAAPRQLSLEQDGASYDQQPLVDVWQRHTMLDVTPAQHEGAQWPGGITLKEYDLGLTALYGGQDNTLKLTWKADQPIDREYTAALEIVDASGAVASAVAPPCVESPTTQWHTHKNNPVSYPWVVDDTLAPGSYTLRLTLRDAASGVALPLADGSQSLDLAQIQVRQR